MEQKGTILFIEEDTDDIEIISAIFQELQSEHELLVFETLEAAFDFLKNASEKPFLIICDSGSRDNNIEHFKSKMNSLPQLKIKSIPMIFYTSEVDSKTVNQAFSDLNVQGVFEKHSNYHEIKEDIKAILEYWERSKQPTI